MKRFLIVPVVALTALLIACADDDAGLGERADISPTPEADGLQYVFDTVGRNMRVSELRQHLDEPLQAMDDEQLAHAALCFPTDIDAEVLDKEIVENGESATLLVNWAVTNIGENEDETVGVQRTWEFRQVGNGDEPEYVITRLPECPFEPGQRVGEDGQPEDDLDDDEVVPAPTP